ncbi:MAG: hypothetical protein AB8G99_01720, partial [Planctomycetaceae bacterium]
MTGAEVLEQRQLLTDVVAVTIKGNSISLVGDGDPNWLTIGRNGDNVWLQGIDGTTFSKDALDPDKGDSLAPDSFVTNIDVGEVESLKINLKGGGDYVEIHPLKISGNTTINLGSGDDDVNFRGDLPTPLDAAVSQGKTIVKGGSGRDAIRFFDWQLDGQTKVASGSGGDLLVLNGTEINGKFAANHGSGNDATYVKESTFSGTSESIVVNGGSGSDVL